MSEAEDLSKALRDEPRPSRRVRRAEKLRARTLSPVRILMNVLAIPGLTAAVALSVYVRTSPYDAPDAVMHLIARTSCDATWSVGLAPAYRGELGYHARNDADGDGIACEPKPREDASVSGARLSDPAHVPTTTRMTGGAKFVKPRD